MKRANRPSIQTRLEHKWIEGRQLEPTVHGFAVVRADGIWIDSVSDSREKAERFLSASDRARGDSVIKVKVFAA